MANRFQKCKTPCCFTHVSGDAIAAVAVGGGAYIAVWHSASLAWAGQSWAGAAKGLAGMDLWEPAVPSTPSNEWAAVRRGDSLMGFNLLSETL